MIEVLNIVKSYGKNNPVLRDISLQISDGEFTVILGASGSGKSTFLNILSGLEHPDSVNMAIFALLTFQIMN